MKKVQLIVEKYDGHLWRNTYIDFITSGRWKTIVIDDTCDLYIEIVEQKDISRWYQRANIQPINRWVIEYKFIEIELKRIVETINECN